MEVGCPLLIALPRPDTATDTTSRPGSSVSEEDQLQLARAIYANGCPLSIVGNKLWAKFLKTLRPSFKIPSRDSISNNLLERVYQECSVTVKEPVASVSSVAVMCDSYTHGRNEEIINFIDIAKAHILEQDCNRKPHWAVHSRS
ncbi:uncharacterized protein LOC143029524 [Oratosquilla oratoria]|uniref:uncharacterized protein LOC143029524 n=1 Tax=Oratosquilla oratoria TaxID=337810 RepID=UPI003F774853